MEESEKLAARNNATIEIMEQAGAICDDLGFHLQYREGWMDPHWVVSRLDELGRCLQVAAPVWKESLLAGLGYDTGEG